MRFAALLLACSLLPRADASADTTATDTVAFDARSFIDSVQQLYSDSLQDAMHFETGIVVLADSVATLNVPANFKYLDADQSRHVIVEIWGNPPEVVDDVLGMIMPAGANVLDNDAFAFVLEYDAMGYVKDDDAQDVDYDEMMEDMKAGEEEQNNARRAAGYPGLAHVGWATPPFYDKERKVLHWAVELHADSADGNTLNYNVRVLGRKGVLILNAVAGMDQLASVQANIPAVLGMATFNDGFKYEQFDSNVDEVAAYTVGGLVAGGVLAKTGLFAGLFKAIALLFVKMKFLWVALVAGVAGLWKWITGRKDRNSLPPAAPPQA